jgi:signal peptidase I
MRVLDRATSRLPQPWRTIVDWTVTLALAAAFVLAFEAEVAKPYKIPSSSMEPTLHCAKPAIGCLASHDDRLIVNRLAYRFGHPKRGQVVVFTAPPRAAACGTDRASTYVKRLIGLPNDVVREDAAARIWVNGRKLQEPYVTPLARTSDRFRNRVWRVPAGEYFMLGDNRGASCDSRTWGAVPRAQLIGPMLVRYWPPTRITVGSS